MTKLQKVIEDFFENVGVYICTLLGIIIAQYGPILLQPAASDVALQWTRIGFSAVIAFYLVINDEAKGDPDGKRNNLKRRLSSAFKSGMTWNVIMGIGVEAIKAAGG